MEALRSSPQGEAACPLDVVPESAALWHNIIVMLRHC